MGFTERIVEWKGTSTALLDELRRRVPTAALPTLPKSARGLTAVLSRLAPSLRAKGYDAAWRPRQGRLQGRLGKNRVGWMTTAPARKPIMARVWAKQGR